MILTSRERVDGSRRGKVAPGAVLGLLAATCFGVSLIALDQAANVDPYWATLILRVGSAVAVLVAVLVHPQSRSRAAELLAGTGRDRDPGRRGNHAFSISTTKGLISVVSAIICVVPVIVAMLARFFVQERLQQIQIAGAALALAGVACISAG